MNIDAKTHSQQEEYQQEESKCPLQKSCTTIRRDLSRNAQIIECHKSHQWNVKQKLPSSQQMQRKLCSDSTRFHVKTFHTLGVEKISLKIIKANITSQWPVSYLTGKRWKQFPSDMEQNKDVHIYHSYSVQFQQVGGSTVFFF